MQNFGMVENSFIRVVDDNTGSEITRYDLKEKLEILLQLSQVKSTEMDLVGNSTL